MINFDLVGLKAILNVGLDYIMIGTRRSRRTKTHSSENLVKSVSTELS